MSRRVRTILISVISLLALGFVSCGQGGGVAGGGLGRTGDQVVLRMQLFQMVNDVEFRLMQEMSDQLLIASDGRLRIEVNPLGTFSTGVEGFPSVTHGVFDIFGGYGTWLRHIDYALHVITTGNMGMDTIAKNIWINEHGGFELAEQLFDRANLVLLAMLTDGTEVGHSRMPITSLDQLQGLRFRSSDTRIHPHLGISGMTLPLEEIFMAFQTGVVDVVEYGHLEINRNLGLTDAARYLFWPDFWNVNNTLSFAMNRQSYNRLPPDLQMMLRMAFRGLEFRHFTATQFASAVAMRELVEAGRNEVTRIADPPETWAEMRRVMFEIEQAEMANYGGMTQAAFESMHEFMTIWFPYRYASRWWGEGLTPQQQAGFDF